MRTREVRKVLFLLFVLVTSACLVIFWAVDSFIGLIATICVLITIVNIIILRYILKKSQKKSKEIK